MSKKFQKIFFQVGNQLYSSHRCQKCIKIFILDHLPGFCLRPCLPYPGGSKCLGRHSEAHQNRPPPPGGSGCLGRHSGEKDGKNPFRRRRRRKFFLDLQRKSAFSESVPPGCRPPPGGGVPAWAGTRGHKKCPPSVSKSLLARLASQRRTDFESLLLACETRETRESNVERTMQVYCWRSPRSRDSRANNKFPTSNRNAASFEGPEGILSSKNQLTATFYLQSHAHQRKAWE